MNYSFRNATVDDIPLIHQLAQKIWREHYPSIISIEQIEFMLLNRYSLRVIEETIKRGEQYFLAYEENEPVGYASIEPKSDFFYLHKFYIDVAKHRAGIGSAFFNFILSRTDLDKPLKLQVNRSNFKAINFYFKVGFVIEAVGDFDIGGGYFMNDFVMVRR